MRLALLVAVAVALAVPGSAAAASPYAPTGRAGPKLTVSAKLLRGSLRCTKNVRHAAREPVLLLPATGVNSDQNFSWNYQRAFERTGVPYCTSDQPGRRSQNLGDLQVRAQYVTYAIRRMRALAGRRIATLGHSQGGMIMRWSLRFWPDTRRDVRDVIGMAGVNHGHADGPRTCKTECDPADWQEQQHAKFIAALNSRSETFRNVAYTEIYTHTDEVVMPNQDDTGSSSVHDGPGWISNVAIQDVCPADTNEHLAIGTSDPVAYALVRDALAHPGPGQPWRIPVATCVQRFQPGIDPATYPADVAGSAVALQTSEYTKLKAEPKLACYVHRVSRCKRSR